MAPPDPDFAADDGFFDSLPEEALRRLEQAAPPAAYHWEAEDEDLDTSEVTDAVGAPLAHPLLDASLQKPARGRPPPQHPLPPPQHHRHRDARPSPSPRLPASNPQWNPNLVPPPRPGFLPALVAAPAATLPLPPPLRRPAHGLAVAAAASPPSLDRLPPDLAASLQRRLGGLESELSAARGEVSIIRTNAAKAQLEFDSQLARLRKLNADQLADHERALAAALAAERNAQTELQFLQRDMRDLSHRSRRRETPAAADPATTTPTKPAPASSTLLLADGFDHFDLASRPGRAPAPGSGSVAPHVGERTPSKSKRKRPAPASPMAALETHPDPDFASEINGHQPASTSVSSRPLPAPDAAAAAAAAVAAPIPSQFLQLVLDHGSLHHQPPTFESLSQLAFPSDPTASSLSTLVLEKLPLMGSPHSPMQLPVDFAEHIISLWARCCRERFWEPVRYLVALVAFALDLHIVSVAPLIIASLVPVARSSLLALVEARRRRRLLASSSAASHELAAAADEHLDSSQILSLLRLCAWSCATTVPDHQPPGLVETVHVAAKFWNLFPLDLVPLLLAPAQDLSDSLALLDLLAASSLPDSIGPIGHPADKETSARAVMEAVSAQLTDPPPPATSLPSSDRRRLRLAAVRTLVAFARYPFGALQLASHDNALPRLVACLSSSIDDLYDQPLPSPASPLPPSSASAAFQPPSAPSSWADLCLLISHSLLLIHSLVTGPLTSNAADISQRLSPVHGASQRYLLALGRLTFADEDLVIEAGIDPEVVEAAHELLELAVTPDEGETVTEAFAP